MTKLETVDLLRAMMREKTLLRFSSRFEGGFHHGYVLAVSDQFLMLAAVSGRIFLDGYECFRIADIRKPRPDPYAAFIEAALKARGETLRPCAVDVSDIKTLLTSASAAFPLVTIYEERPYPDECRIGRLQSIQRGWMTLREINPDATWDEEPTRHRLRDITRIDFDGSYERALDLVGGAEGPSGAW